MGRAQAHTVAKRADISRTNAYPVLNKLIEKGVVSVQLHRGVSYYLANPPSALFTMVKKEEEALKRKQNNAEQLVKLLEPVFKSKNYIIPKLRFCEGNSNVESLLFEQLDEWFASMMKYDDILWGYQDESFIRQYGKWLDKYWRNKSETHQIRLFCNLSEEELEANEKIANRRTRYLGPDFEMQSGIWICGDYIVMLMTKDKPHYAHQINDPVFAANLRLVFKKLWELSSQYPPEGS